jgi:ABC-2 type transport system ATP-binding protein
MLGDPSLLILDEPTSGLDPRGSWQIRQKITSLNEQGTTIFLSSHILSEVQEVSHRVAILNHGMLMALDTLDNLGKRLDLQPLLKIEVRHPSEELVERIRGVDGVRDARLIDRTIVIRCDPQTKTAIVKFLEDTGADIVDFKTEEPSLEEVFLRFTEE